MFGLSHRSLAIVVVLLTLAWAWPKFGLMGAIALCDCVGLVLICFPETIDDLTFGSFARGGQINVHTPPFMIAGVGWILILLLAGILIWPKHVMSRY
jgi:hypothetical protein